MTERWEAVRSALDSAALARAYALAAFGTFFAGHAIEALAGSVTLVTIAAGLVVVGIAILAVRRAEISLLRFVPVSVLLFITWAGITLILPMSGPTRSLSHWLALVGVAIVAVVIAHVRDTLQTVRALGDVLRTLLTGSLLVEILSGVLLDMPIPFLGVQGAIAAGGPIQGLFGTRNMLGFVAVIALITFVIELRTHSITRGLGIYSLVLAGSLAALSSSPTVIVLSLAVAIASAALAIVRHTPAERRTRIQWILGALVVVGIGTAYVFRHQVIALLDAGTDFSTRAELWNSILVQVRSHAYQAWGWVGPWNPDDPLAFPYTAINLFGRHHASALSAYFDVLLQLGWLGLVLFAFLAGTALVRAWLVASERRSVLYAWTPLVLVTLLVDSVFESFTLFGVGWLMLALCAMRAGQSRSWRETAAARAPETPGSAR